MTHLSRLSEELILWMSPRFGFIDIADRFCTGSSIMPQKKNPDPLEIIRAAAGMLVGAHTQTATIVKGLPAGYQRDLQLLKQPFVQGVKLSKHSFQAMQIVLQNLKVNSKKLEKAASDTHLFAADLANELVLKKGLSFREAYRKVKESYTHAGWRGVIEFDDVPRFDPVKQIRSKKSDGMPGNLRLDVGRKWLAAQSRKMAGETKRFENALEKIWQL